MAVLGTSEEASDLLAKWWEMQVAWFCHPELSQTLFPSILFSGHKWWLIPPIPHNNTYNGIFTYILYFLKSALQLVESFHSLMLHQT